MMPFLNFCCHKNISNRNCQIIENLFVFIVLINMIIITCCVQLLCSTYNYLLLFCYWFKFFGKNFIEKFTICLGSVFYVIHIIEASIVVNTVIILSLSARLLTVAFIFVSNFSKTMKKIRISLNYLLEFWKL